MSLTKERFEQPAPRLVPPRAYRRFLHPFVLRRVTPSTRRLLERNEVYFPYFAMRVRFDDRRLGPGPRVESYFHRLVRYAQAAGWGRR